MERRNVRRFREVAVETDVELVGKPKMLKVKLRFTRWKEKCRSDCEKTGATNFAANLFEE